MPIAEGALGWNGFLKQVGFDPPSVYEVSANGVVLEGEQFTELIQLFCLDGDWLNESGFGDIGYRVEGDNDFISDPDGRIVGVGGTILEFPISKFVPRKVIGYEVSVQYGDSSSSIAPNDIPFTVTILCLSPSSLMTVGGEWQATDTTALIIGYSVLNAYWLAPIGIGIGLGVYLTINRWQRR